MAVAKTRKTATVTRIISGGEEALTIFKSLFLTNIKDIVMEMAKPTAGTMVTTMPNMSVQRMQLKSEKILNEVIDSDRNIRFIILTIIQNFTTEDLQPGFANSTDNQGDMVQSCKYQEP